MANFKPIAVEEFSKRKGGKAGQGRGEVVAPLVQDFLDSGLEAAEVDLTEFNQSHATIASNIRAYLKRKPELGVRMATIAPDRDEDNKPVKGTGTIKLGRTTAVGESTRKSKASAEGETELFDQMATA